MTITYPEGTPSQGQTTVVVTSSIASTSAPSLATDYASATNISCYLYGNFDATSTTNKGTAPTRLCDTSQREQFGRTAYSITDIEYTYDPQNGSTGDVNAAKDALTPGTEVWFTVREGGGAAKTDKLAADDVVSLHHVKLGPQNRTRTGDDEFAEYSITQSVVYVEDPIYDVSLAA